MQKTEYEKMLAGELYDASDKELLEMRIRSRAFMHAYNQMTYDKEQREMLLQKFLGKIGKNIDIQTPFFCDYGSHVVVGDNFFANFNCTFLDCNFIRSATMFF